MKNPAAQANRVQKGELSWKDSHISLQHIYLRN